MKFKIHLYLHSDYESYDVVQMFLNCDFDCIILGSNKQEQPGIHENTITGEYEDQQTGEESTKARVGVTFLSGEEKYKIS